MYSRRSCRACQRAHSARIGQVSNGRLYDRHGERDVDGEAPSTPSITWTTPVPIPFGMALSGTQLDAAASVTGTFTYNPAAGTIPAMGSDTLTVILTPTDAMNYTTATASVTLIVGQPAPVLGSLSPAFGSAGGLCVYPHRGRVGIHVRVRG